MQTKRKKKGINVITNIFIIALFIVMGIAVGKGFYEWINTPTTIEKEEDPVIHIEAPDYNPDLSATYVNETKYIGGIGYSEVYNTPFGKSSSYVSNKEFWNKHPEIVEDISNKATQFMNLMVQTSYRDILDNQEPHLHNVLQLMDRDWTYDVGNAEDILCEEYMRDICNSIIENKISMKGEFITDTSLVYEDNLLFVRGVVEYEVFSSDLDSLPADGEKKHAMVEVVLHRDNEDLDNYSVVGWYGI